MNMYQSQDFCISLHTGRVVLDAKQASRRKHLLKPIEVDKDGAGTYEIIKGPVNFKKDEIFGYDGQLPKSCAFINLDAEPVNEIPEDAEAVEIVISEDPDALEAMINGEAEQFPKKIGGPHYLLSNGDKVKGKEKAEAAQAELDANG